MTLEQKRDAIMARAERMIESLMKDIATAGGDPDYIEPWKDMTSDIRVAFIDAIDKRDQRNDQWDRAAAAADLRRDMERERI